MAVLDHPRCVWARDRRGSLYAACVALVTLCVAAWQIRRVGAPLARRFDGAAGVAAADVFRNATDAWATPREFLQNCDRLEPSGEPLLGDFSMLAPLLRPADGAGFGDVLAALTELYAFQKGHAGSRERQPCLRGAAPPRRGPPRIALAMLVDYPAPLAPWVALSIENKRRYAARHGYAFELFTESDPGRPAVWSKLVALLLLLGRGEAEWAAWIDLDTVIMDAAVPLARFADARADVVVALDANGINAGVLFVRDSDWARMLLVAAWALNDSRVPAMEYWREQAAIMELARDPFILNHLWMEPQRRFTTYARFSGSHGDLGTVPPDTFLLHFAGVRDSENGAQRLAELVEHHSAAAARLF